MPFRITVYARLDYIVEAFLCISELTFYPNMVQAWKAR